MSGRCQISPVTVVFPSSHGSRTYEMSSTPKKLPRRPSNTNRNGASGKQGYKKHSFKYFTDYRYINLIVQCVGVRLQKSFHFTLGQMQISFLQSYDKNQEVRSFIPMRMHEMCSPPVHDNLIYANPDYLWPQHIDVIIAGRQIKSSS